MRVAERYKVRILAWLRARPGEFFTPAEVRRAMRDLDSTVMGLTLNGLVDAKVIEHHGGYYGSPRKEYKKP